MANPVEETRMQADRDRRARGPGAGPSGWADLPVIESGKLFGGATEVGIVHEGALYRLKITRQGKLVLNK